MRSMTGFGRGEAPVLDEAGAALGTLVVEIRTVNHRYFDARLRLPSALSALNAPTERRLKARIVRGRTEYSARLALEGATAAPQLDQARAAEAIRQLRELRDAACPAEPVPMHLLSNVPDLFSAPPGPDADLLAGALEAATDAALDELEAMRAREGAAIQSDFEGLLSELDGLMARVDERRPTVAEDYETRLRARIEKLAADEGVSLDPRQLVHEIAVFAERTDVAEEVQRLREHITAFRSQMAAKGAVGRKLDFLMQELGRETNTLGSKSPDVTLTHLVVDMKGVLERIREQVQNVL